MNKAKELDEKILTLKEIEHKYIKHRLILNHFNIAKTKKELGISRSTLYRAIKHLNLDLDIERKKSKSRF